MNDKVCLCSRKGRSHEGVECSVPLGNKNTANRYETILREGATTKQHVSHSTSVGPNSWDLIFTATVTTFVVAGKTESFRGP